MIGPGVAIVLSSAVAVKELMDKQSGVTPDRPANYIARLLDDGLNLALAPYCKIDDFLIVVFIR